MSKTIRNSFYKKLSFEKLLEAHIRASKNKSNKKEVVEFCVDLETNIISILNQLKQGKYKVGKYKTFVIHEPKKRIIKALPYKDRVVQQWYVTEFIKPYFIPRFITDSYACIDGKGTHSAVNKVQKYMQVMNKECGSYYVLKCDIRKYFHNINKDVLFSLLSKCINDKKLLDLSYQFIYDDDDGIPIGNYTSQYFANIYLDVLDKYVKEELKIKYYVRYMDDFILLLKDKEESKMVKLKVEEFIKEKLCLELNAKSRYYPSSLGIDFCGYRIYETHRLLRNSSKKKMKRKINIWNKLYFIDRLDMDRMVLSWNSWISHSKHANSYYLRCRMRNRIKFKKVELKSKFSE